MYVDYIHRGFSVNIRLYFFPTNLFRLECNPIKKTLIRFQEAAAKTLDSVSIRFKRLGEKNIACYVKSEKQLYSKSASALNWFQSTIALHPDRQKRDSSL